MIISYFCPNLFVLSEQFLLFQKFDYIVLFYMGCFAVFRSQDKLQA
jgi:hypothetical protein